MNNGKNAGKNSCNQLSIRITQHLFWVHHAPSPETVALNLPLASLPADQYAHNLVHRLHEAHTHFCAIKEDLRRELYDIAARHLHVFFFFKSVDAQCAAVAITSARQTSLSAAL